MTNKFQKDAFNIGLLNIDAGLARTLQPISVVDIFSNPSTMDFHDDGLYSTKIFGHVGDPDRDSTFAYIDFGTHIMHPAVFHRLERIYKPFVDIMAGKLFAKWDDVNKTFIVSNEMEGETGYQFAMSYFNDMVLTKNDSDIRNMRIDFINTTKDKAKLNKVLVLPAGLRDAEVDSLGRIQEDEINEEYRRLIAISRTISNTNPTAKINDRARASLQVTFNKIHDHIMGMMKGGNGFIQTKLISRKTLNGIRTVITANSSSPSNLNDKYSFGPNDTGIGLYHVSRGALPITKVQLSNYLETNFSGADGQTMVVDSKSLKRKYVDLDSTEYDRWTTPEGIEKVISAQANIERRSRPVLLGDDYLALVYVPKHENVFKVFHDIDELPDGFSRKDVRPMTLHELIYLCNYRGWNKLKTLVTRYPVSGEDSVYPSNIFLRTTVKSDVRRELDDQWQPMSEEFTAIVYPAMDDDIAYVDSGYLHPSRLDGLGGDFDGDMVNMPIIYTKEGCDAIDVYYKSVASVLNPNGKFRASPATDTINLTMFTMTYLDESLS